MRFITSFFCALFALSLLATTPLRAAAMGPTDMGSLAVLLGNEGVRNSLSLTASQRQQLNALRASFKSEARQLVAKTPANASAADLAKADATLTSIRKKSNRQAYQVLNKQQQADIVKIEAKILGGSILLSTPIQKELGITSAQKAKIAAIHADSQGYDMKVHSLYHEGKIGHFQKIARLHKARIQEANKLIKVLTPTQRAAFDKLRS